MLPLQRVTRRMVLDAMDIANVSDASLQDAFANGESLDTINTLRARALRDMENALHILDQWLATVKGE